MNHTCKTYISVRLNDNNLDDVINELKKITTDYKINLINNKKLLFIGYNENYDVDVNEMLKVTLKTLIGKEDLILNLQKKFNLETALVINPYIKYNSNLPKQIISIDKWVVEFLYKSNTYEDLDYYII